jgi:hypothetical protein
LRLNAGFTAAPETSLREDLQLPVRKIPKNYRSVTGLVASNDESHQVTAYESSLERDCIKHVIFNKNVARHEEQPVTISFICGGKQYSYTPDLLITYRNDVARAKRWKPLLAEIKYRSDLFKDWHKLKPKFHAARRYAIERAWDFAIITDSEIRTPYLKNITLLLECCKHPMDDAVTKLLLEALNSLGRTNPDTLLRSISEDSLTRAKMIPTLWQLVADYRIRADLEKPLTMNSRIWSKPREERSDSDEPIHHSSAGRCRRKCWRALRYQSYLEP